MFRSNKQFCQIAGSSLIFLLIVAPTATAQVYEKLFSFTEQLSLDQVSADNKGSYPQGGLLLGSDGNFYGTTKSGGGYNFGTIFRLGSDGKFTTLVDFTAYGATNRGADPLGRLIQARDGNFYGTTSSWGGSSQFGSTHGTVFKMTPSGTLTTLVVFSGNGSTNKGSSPFSGLVQGLDGLLYGTTYSGGTNGLGTLFKVNYSGTLTTMVNFSGNAASNKGSNPVGSLIQASDGNFYGTTSKGGESDNGTVFMMTPGGILTTLVEFSNNGTTNKGRLPESSLVEAIDGRLLGTTTAGGATNEGTIFRMTKSGDLETIADFKDHSGSAPTELALAGDGNYYVHSIASFWTGYSFRLTPAGVLTRLGGLFGTISGYPEGKLISGGDGYLYGVISSTGGSTGYGTVYRMDHAGTRETLVRFTGKGFRDTGEYPYPSLTETDPGVFVGTTNEGGSSDLGSVFRITAAGSVETVHSFTNTSVAANPTAGLIGSGDGNLYGTTSNSIFRILPDDTFEKIASSGSSSTLFEDANGVFWGTTTTGGANGLGTIFKSSRDGTVTIIVDFTGTSGTNRGSRPYSGLISGPDGFLYGTTSGGGNHDLGTLYKISLEGVLSTLVDFTGNGVTNRGSAPQSSLVVGNDGALYGCTRNGGSGNYGTVFKYESGEGLTTLVEFSGNGASNRGYYPVSGLTVGNNGRLYGTTSSYFDGISFRSYGTIFTLSDLGEAVTVFDFGTDPTDAEPNGPLILGSDGNLYGTTRSPFDPTVAKRIGQGSVFRVIFPGTPNIFPVAPSLDNATSARVSAKINPRGSTTSVVLDYGSDGVSFPYSITLEVGLSGFQTVIAGSTLANLTPGEEYFFRFRAMNASGETISPVQSFSTPSKPSVFAGLANNITSTSARFNGEANAQGHETMVGFEWGTDGNDFPFIAGAVPALIDGNSVTNIGINLAGLTKGTTYYYRVVATNEGGTTVSGTQSFRTLTEPVPQVGGSFALSTTSARVEGLVDPEGSDTTVVFEYGTDGENFPNSVSASQGLQSGSGNRPVSAVFSNLAQGTTYHFRLRATSDGGVGVSGTATFSMNVLSGFEQVIPGAPSESGGFLTVNLSPPGLLHGWRFVGETEWRDPRIQARGLVTGRYEIEFRPVPGYITPFPLRGDHAVEIESGAAPAIVEAFYYATGAAGAGGLSVTLKPDSIITGEGRAQWRLLGEGEEDWRNSASTVSGLVAGNYLVELKPVTNRTTPAHVSVLVVEGQTTAPTVTYFSSGDTTGIAPVPLAFETIAATEDNPFAFVGQIRSRSGLGTGFVVKPRVVATAAHVVWDEGTLSGAEGLQWIHRQHRGVHEPPPHVPRGFFILTGYDEARTLESSPGSFSPQSRNRDIAALYFTDRDAAQGGYGGFLASDLEANEFLLSNANKRFAAYPIDGIANLSRGLMHATTPFNIGFSPVSFTPLATGQPPLPEGRRLFFTTDIRSSGGASGGPLFVQFEGGAYYPAAVYLGGTSQMIVRAIDSAAVELFNRAAESSIEDNGNTGGGITHSGVTPIGGADTAAALKVNLAPAGAVAAGARWRLGPDAPWRSSGEQAGGLSNARYILEFSAVPGYQLPAPQTVQVKGGQLKTVTFSYALLPVPAAAITLRGNGRSIGNGDTSPSPLDGSDFGVVAVDGGTATRTFSISNPGTSELSVGSLVVDGMNEDDFSISIPPGSAIPPGGSTTFTILFDPSAPGTRSATVSFATNVTGSNPFTFSIQGNDSTDSDSDGFTDVEEASLADLLAGFTVGQTIDLDLSFLRLGSGQILALLNLPPGLSFDPGTNRITGTITGKAANPQVEIRKVDGANIISSVTTDFPVVIPARVTVSGAHPFPATRIGRRSRPQTLIVTNSGELALGVLTARSIGKAARDFVLTQPRTKTLDAGGTTTVTVTFKPRAKGIRRAGITIFSNTNPKTVPVSGRGK